jgi:adenosylhomocysteine nucleosidase
MAFEAQFVGRTLAESLLGDGEDIGQAAVPATLHHHRNAVIAFVGMAFEAKIAAGPGVLVFARDSRRELTAAAKDAARLGYRGIISFGVAGGLASGLRPGDWVVASEVLASDMKHSTDQAWSSRLRDAIGGSNYASIIGVDTPIAEPATKQALHRTTGAVAVDMESHVVAQVAAAHGLAFAALRVIVDPVDRTIPPAALMGMGSGPRADSAAVLRELIARPAQLPRLVRVALDAYLARCAMQRARQLLGPHFGLTDPGLPALAQSGADQSDLSQADIASYHAPA